MPKKRQQFKAFKPSLSGSPSAQASSSSSVTDKPTRGVNDLLADLRRTSIRSSPASPLPANSPSLPPAIREILQLPETPAPAPRRPLRHRLDGNGRRLPAGPPPPRSWTVRGRDNVALQNERSHLRQGSARFALAPMPGVSLPEPGSLIDLVLRRIALDWDIHQVYNKYHLFFIPGHLKSALIRFVSMTSTHGISLDDLKAILMPPPDGYDQEELDSIDPSYQALTFLDLSGAIGRSLRLKEIGELLFPTAQTSVATEPQESWDAVEVSIAPSRELLPNLTHLSLALVPNHENRVSWRQLLALAPKLSAVTHLSLAFWPDPCLTPGALYSSVASPQGRNIPYGGTTLYSHSIDHDWTEALLVLRMVSRMLYKLEFLDLTGCLTWFKALTLAVDQDYVDWSGYWDPLRSPSTSPPPAPPPESLMIAGPAADDRYRMVEDEFLSTAQRFTTHLHRAEYARLKLEAKSQNAAAIREIERPVVGRATAEASHRHQALKRAGKQRIAMQESGNEPGSSDLPWMGTSLQGLMESPKGDFPSIVHAPGGSKMSPAVEHRPTLLHLQAPPSSPGARSRERLAWDTGSSVANTARSVGRTHDPDAARRSTSDEQSIASLSLASFTPQRTAHALVPHASSKHGALAARPQNEDAGAVGSDEDNDDLFGLRERKIRREKSREQMRRGEQHTRIKSPTRDTIPSFL